MVDNELFAEPLTRTPGPVAVQQDAAAGWCSVINPFTRIFVLQILLLLNH